MVDRTAATLHCGCRREKQQQEAEAERMRKEKADKEAADKAAAGWLCFLLVTIPEHARTAPHVHEKPWVLTAVQSLVGSYCVAFYRLHMQLTLFPRAAPLLSS